jgi:ElaB/YqjD/DUF883 family membrane-anchored ribosome-binding protein
MISLSGTRPDSAPTNGLHGFAFGESAGEVVGEARKRLAEAGEFVKTVVTTQPALALGAALAAGVVIGWLIKRR